MTSSSWVLPTLIPKRGIFPLHPDPTGDIISFTPYRPSPRVDACRFLMDYTCTAPINPWTVSPIFFAIAIIQRVWCGMTLTVRALNPFSQKQTMSPQHLGNPRQASPASLQLNIPRRLDAAYLLHNARRTKSTKYFIQYILHIRTQYY